MNEDPSALPVLSVASSTKRARTSAVAASVADEEVEEEVEDEEKAEETDDPSFHAALSTVNAMLRKRGYHDLPTTMPTTDRRTRFADYDAFTHRLDDEEDRLWVFFTAQFASTEVYDAMREHAPSTGAIVVSRVPPTKRKTADGYELFLISELQEDITLHRLQPTFLPLSVEEGKAVLARYFATPAKFPKMSEHDPVARFYGLKPGRVVKIVGKSETAGESVKYRVVIAAPQR